MGTVVVPRAKDQKALLWADGRYWIQAENELDAKHWSLVRMGAPKVKDLSTWLATVGYRPSFRLSFCPFCPFFPFCPFCLWLVHQLLTRTPIYSFFLHRCFCRKLLWALGSASILPTSLSAKWSPGKPLP